ncbi:hypothetical protein [Lysobacter gummosus]
MRERAGVRGFPVARIPKPSRLRRSPSPRPSPASGRGRGRGDKPR